MKKKYNSTFTTLLQIKDWSNSGIQSFDFINNKMHVSQLHIGLCRKDR